MDRNIIKYTFLLCILIFHYGQLTKGSSAGKLDSFLVSLLAIKNMSGRTTTCYRLLNSFFLNLTTISFFIDCTVDQNVCGEDEYCEEGSYKGQF